MGRFMQLQVSAPRSLAEVGPADTIAMQHQSIVSTRQIFRTSLSGGGRINNERTTNSDTQQQTVVGTIDKQRSLAVKLTVCVAFPKSP